MSAVPRVFFVTGANKGLGYETVRVIAERFGDQAIALLGTRSIENGHAAIAKMKQSNPSFDYSNVEAVEIDVTKPASIQAAADYVKSKFGHVHVLVNNSGIFGRSEGYVECFKVNVYGASDVFETFRPLLVPNESDHIIIGSDAGAWSLFALPPGLQEILEDVHALDIATVRRLLDDWLEASQGKPSQNTWPPVEETRWSYGLSKAVIMALGRKWAIDYPDIKTTNICPGYCATDLNAHAGPLSASQGAEYILYPIFNPEVTQSGKYYSEGVELEYKFPQPTNFFKK